MLIFGPGMHFEALFMILTKGLLKNCPWWSRAQLSRGTSLDENSYYVFLSYWGKYLAIVDENCLADTETFIFMTILGSGHVLVKKFCLGVVKLGCDVRTNSQKRDPSKFTIANSDS